MSTERSAVTVPPPSPGGAEELDRQFGEREMQARLFGAREDRAGLGGGLGGSRARTAQTTMSSSGGSGDVTRVVLARVVELESGGAAVVQHPRELAAAHERQQALRRPERDRRGAGPRAFEADLAEVQFVRTEIGVRRIVVVVDADCRVAKQHAAAAVGLQAVLVRIDDDRIGVVEAVEGRARRSPRLSASVK